MPNTRANFDPNDWLEDDSQEVNTDLNRVLDIVASFRGKYAKRESLTHKLAAALDAKQKELAQVTKNNQLDVTYLRNTAVDLQTKYRDQSRRMKNLRRENNAVKNHNKQLAEELDRAKEQLQQMNHLVCDICYDNAKSVVTRCGHGFCKGCLSTMFRRNEENPDRWGGLFLIKDADCPNCRRPIRRKEDVWPIFIAEDQQGGEEAEAN